jgi:hypothetical protein
MPIDPRYAVRALIGLAGFGLISAAIGTVLAIAQQGGGVPASYLAGTPFTSFLVPGLILGGIVGGTQFVAALALWRRWPTALVWAAIAAFGMLLWIFIELAMIKHYSWLQTAYFALGVVELVLVLALLGIAPGVMRRWGPEPY